MILFSGLTNKIQTKNYFLHVIGIKKEQKVGFSMLIIAILSLFVINYNVYAVNSVQSNNIRSFPSYQKAQEFLLDKVKSAKGQILIASEFLSDGDIATALFIAKYKKVGVKVLLNRVKNRNLSSRLRYLKRQNINVFALPYKWRYPRIGVNIYSAILLDKELLLINRYLDSKAKRKPKLVKVYKYRNDSKTYSEFVVRFTNEYNKKLPTTKSVVPLVGKPLRQRRKVFDGMQAYKPGRKSTRRNRYNQNGAFQYSGKDRVRPSDMPAALPSQTITGKK